MIIRRITLVRIQKPRKHSINDELQWFGSALGLFSERDRNKSAFRIFIELIKASKTNEGLSSDELAHKLSLTRPTVVHHLNSLMERGIVLHRLSSYIINGEDLSSLVDSIERDMDRAISEMRKSAQELDKILGL